MLGLINHFTSVYLLTGYVIAFRLDSLLQLIIDTRGTENKKTPMHNLCKELAARSPQLLNFYDDLASLDAASKIQLEMLGTEMHEVVKGLKKVQLEYDASQMDGPVSETFLMKLKEFTDNAQADVESLSSLFSIVGKNVDALIKYFGEDPSRCPYERAHEENLEQAELEKKNAEKDTQAEKTKSAQFQKTEGKL